MPLDGNDREPAARAALRDLGLLVLRVGTGAMMLLGHGAGKLGLLGASPLQFPDPVGVGAFPSLLLALLGEVVGSVLVILGLGTRVGALFLLATMGVAALVVHGDDPWARKELAVAFAVPALTLLLTGPGRLSFDHVLARRRRARRGSLR